VLVPYITPWITRLFEYEILEYEEEGKRRTRVDARDGLVSRYDAPGRDNTGAGGEKAASVSLWVTWSGKTKLGATDIEGHEVRTRGVKSLHHGFPFYSWDKDRAPYICVCMIDRATFQIHGEIRAPEARRVGVQREWGFKPEDTWYVQLRDLHPVGPPANIELPDDWIQPLKQKELFP
jgi:hypothetical protein